MTPELIAVHDSMTVEQALDHLRKSATREGAIHVYVGDDHEHPVGVVPLRRPDHRRSFDPVHAVHQPDVVSVSADTDQEEVARFVTKHHLPRGAGARMRRQAPFLASLPRPPSPVRPPRRLTDAVAGGQPMPALTGHHGPRSPALTLEAHAAALAKLSDDEVRRRRQAGRPAYDGDGVATYGPVRISLTAPDGALDIVDVELRADGL